MRDYFGTGLSTRIVFPVDGDVISEADGRTENGELFITVQVSSDRPVKVNGVPAKKSGELWLADVKICGEKTAIFAQSDKCSHEIAVYRLKKRRGVYRLSSDDNIVFLYNINKNRDVYTSIFDDPYLAIYKKAHDLYGASVHLNVYYQMPAKDIYFSETRADFDLSMMTDKFRDEWRANSDWLRLNFHARKDQPDMPYINTDRKTISDDCRAVQEQIIRFAGEETLSRETTVHFGECTEEGVHALRELGIKNLAGYFIMHKGAPLVSYFYPESLILHVGKRDLWFDRETDMLYARISSVLNRHTADESIAMLEKEAADPRTSGYLEVMIHEEYFYPDSKIYLPDFEERLLLPCKWLYDHGYRGSFIDDLR